MDDTLSILFVDDERRILDGLRRMLRSKRRQWNMSFATNGPEALEALAQAAHDVVLTDIRMPGMSGVEFLEQVRRRHSDVVRMALSGQASSATALDAVQPAHQYLAKPCDAETLKGVLGRVAELRRRLEVPDLRGAACSLVTVPSAPGPFDALRAELDRPEATGEAVGRTIGRDVGFSAKLAQLLSSGFLDPSGRTCTPAGAVNAIGLDVVRSLVNGLAEHQRMDPGQAQRFDVEGLCRRSARAAVFARRICRLQCADRETTDTAALAALLADVGKLVLAVRRPEAGPLGGPDALEAERRTFGATHAQVGAYLLGIWGLPDELIDAVGRHHAPAESPAGGRFTPAAAVHVASVLAGQDLLEGGSEAVDEVDGRYIESLGLGGALPRWVSACRDAAEKEYANA